MAKKFSRVNSDGSYRVLGAGQGAKFEQAFDSLKAYLNSNGWVQVKDEYGTNWRKEYLGKSGTSVIFEFYYDRGGFNEVTTNIPLPSEELAFLRHSVMGFKSNRSYDKGIYEDI